jgi:HEAT repeat protein
MIKKIMEIIANRKKSKQIKIDNPVSLQLANNIKDTNLIELLSDNIKLSAIPDAFQLLLSSDEKIKLQAAEVLNHVMSTLNHNRLIKVDKIFRDRSSYDWQYDWRNKNPEELLHPLMSEEEKVSILGLSSFHSNGYFREKAIIALADMKTGAAVPYLLIRINDWVRTVRSTSKERLLRYITPEYTAYFVSNLPLVLRLKECSREEHTDIIDSIVSIMSSEEGSHRLVSGLQSADSKVRLACYKIILQTKVMDNRSIINHLIKDTNPYNRLFVLRNIRQEITQDEFLNISQLLLHDKFSRIRIFALEVLYSFMPEETRSILEEGLFDNNQSVRALSRYLLSKHSKYDFAAIYRDAIQKSERLYASICGLGETGNINDSEIIIKFMDSDVVKIVNASINALARLDIQGYKEKILLFLNDDRAGVSKLSRRVLSKEINASDSDTIYRIFKQATFNHVKINACILLCLLSKWDAIRYIIEFCSDKNKDISLIGQSALERWEGRYNKSFTTPSSMQIKEIREALDCFGKYIKDSDRDFVEFCIKNFY